jgi:hypothetical protein
MGLEAIVCPYDGATDGFTKVEPDTYYCPHHKGLFKYVDPTRIIVDHRQSFCDGHCGPCGARADAECVRCGRPHCIDEHYFRSVRDLDRLASGGNRVPSDGPIPWGVYIERALVVGGPGCEKCLLDWAQGEEKQYRRLLDSALRVPDAGVLRSLSEWPYGFQALMSADQCQRLFRAAFTRLRPDRDLVEISVRRGFLNRGKVTEVSRMPVFQVGTEWWDWVITPEGALYQAREGSRRDYNRGLIIADEVSFVLVDPGGPVVVGEYFEGVGGYGQNDQPAGFDVTGEIAYARSDSLMFENLKLFLTNLSDAIG